MFDLDDAADHGFDGRASRRRTATSGTRRIKLAFEKEMLGIYVSDHPLREIEERIRDAAHALARRRRGVQGRHDRLVRRHPHQRGEGRHQERQADDRLHARGPRRLHGRARCSATRTASTRRVMAEDADRAHPREGRGVGPRAASSTRSRCSRSATTARFDRPPGVLVRRRCRRDGARQRRRGAAARRSSRGIPGRDAVHVVTGRNGERKKVKLAGRAPWTATTRTCTPS